MCAPQVELTSESNLFFLYMHDLADVTFKQMQVMPDLGYHRQWGMDASVDRRVCTVCAARCGRLCTKKWLRLALRLGRRTGDKTVAIR